MWKTCKSCGDDFEAEEAWKKLCFPCWKDKKDAEEPLGYSKPREVKVVYTPVKIPEDMLRVLINLCHPDKHGGKDMATKATQYLLELRGK